MMIEELAQSVKSNGLLQPIGVLKTNGKAVICFLKTAWCLSYREIHIKKL